MKTLERTEAESLALSAKTPWFLARCNRDGVTVKDSDGNEIVSHNFSDFPSEWGSGMAEQVAITLRAQARIMVLLTLDL